MPAFEEDSRTLQSYINKHGSSKGWWHNFDKYIVSLLKSYYGDNATSANEFGFNYLPRITGDHSELGYWLDMQDGKMEGLFVMGQNPGRGRAECPLTTDCHVEIEMDGRTRVGGNGDSFFLEGFARSGKR